MLSKNVTVRSFLEVQFIAISGSLEPSQSTTLVSLLYNVSSSFDTETGIPFYSLSDVPKEEISLSACSSGSGADDIAPCKYSCSAVAAIYLITFEGPIANSASHSGSC